MKCLYLFFVLGFLACFPQTDSVVKVFHNGQILTVNSENQTVASIAVAGETILELGDLALIKEKYKHRLVEYVDLKGGTLMPALYDSHCHPVWGAMKDLFQLNFPWYDEPAVLKEKILKYIKDEQPEIILGGAWGSQYFEKYKIHPRQWLDEIESEIPIVLFDDASHNLWVNSAGLKLGNISKATPDPKNGRIEKDANGELTGILYENATFLIRDRITHADSKYRASLDYAQKQALSFGIIGLRDAAADETTMRILSEMDKTGKLEMFFGLCQATPNMARDTALDISKYTDNLVKYKTDNVDPSFIKFFLDGIPTTSRTAAMLCTYKKDGSHTHHDHGMIHISEDILFEDVSNLDKHGFTVKIHAAGDSSARAAINAINYARKTNGDNDLIHEIAHASYIADSDLPRMQKNNIAADLSPYLWYPSPIIDNILSAVCDEKGKEFWEIKKIYQSNIHCVAGSDWPAVAIDMNPWIGLEAMVTRKNPVMESEATFLPNQKITLEQAIRIFTINGAESMKRKDVSGSLEKGKYADFIILDKPILDIEPEAISDIRVIETYYKGDLKFERKI